MSSTIKIWMFKENEKYICSNRVSLFFSILIFIFLPFYIIERNFISCAATARLRLKEGKRYQTSSFVISRCIVQCCREMAR